MLDDLRKRFGSLISGRVSVVEEELADGPRELSPQEGQKKRAVEALLLARRESQKREARLILTERIHNRAAMLLNEIRTDLLQRVHGRIEEENQSESFAQSSRGNARSRLHNPSRCRDRRANEKAARDDEVRAGRRARRRAVVP